jgi:hypothetical protein
VFGSSASRISPFGPGLWLIEVMDETEPRT